MLTTTDPMDMTPEERRSEVGCMLAAGFLRTKCCPAQWPDPPRAGAAGGRLSRASSRRPRRP
jgi:hypothetical protein